MVNLKSLFAVLSALSLVMAAVGLLRFAVDLWHYFHAAEVPSHQLDYRGLWMTLSAVVLSAIFFLVYRKIRD